MHLIKAILFFYLVNVSTGCDVKTYSETAYIADTVRLADANSSPVAPTVRTTSNTGQKINTADVIPESIITFAQTLIGTAYKYGSIDPVEGFDCSGFITYVFNNFNIKVPRSSRDFEFAGADVSLAESKPGDLILFTGTDSTIRTIGHMGIITQAEGAHIDFIHSSSGKANGVVVTPLNDYYMGRFMKVVRIF